MKENNVLHIILREESLVTREKRNTLMKKYFDLCTVRNIKIGNEPGSKHSFFYYISPEEQLTRFLGDENVFEQYLASGKRNTMYDDYGEWYGDFYQSQAYQELLKTLPENSDPVPLIKLLIYR